MKRVLYILYFILSILEFYLLSNFCINYFQNYCKQVILGGTNLGIYLEDNSDNNLLSSSSNDIVSGTLTYIDNNTFGAFGHGYNSNIKEGSVIETKVISIVKSNTNSGFTLVEVNKKNVIGKFNKNSEVGVFGNLYKFDNKEYIEVGMPKEIKKGKAYIKTTINDSDSLFYEIEINHINMFSKKNNIYFQVVDQNLIEKTGGLIKGMSGSPIIQNGKIIGAVSKSYEQNYLRGSGVFITRMLSNK